MCCFLTVRRLTQVLAAKNALWGIFMAGLTWLKECPSHTHFLSQESSLSYSLTKVDLHWKQKQSGITRKHMETRQSRPVEA